MKKRKKEDGSGVSRMELCYLLTYVSLSKSKEREREREMLTSEFIKVFRGRDRTAVGDVPGRD